MLHPYIRHDDRDHVAYARIALLLGVSLLCHLCLAEMLGVWVRFEAQDAKAQAAASSVQVRFMSDADLDRVFREAKRASRDAEQREKKKEEEKKPPEPKEKPYRPEDTLSKAPEVQPKRADYSGRQASVAERQQIKRGRPGSATPMQRPPSPAKPSTPERPTPEPSRQQESAEASPTPKSSDLPLPKAQDQEKSSVVVKPSEPSSAGKSGPPSPVKRPAQAPSAQALFAPQVAPSVLNEMGDGGVFNSLEDIPDGDKTELNRVRSRYWIFWDRFTRQIKRQWNPVGELRKRDPYGNVYGVGAFQTVVMITLKADGSVQKVRVEQSSEQEFLDDEAVRAITAAAPFTNPPEGLKDEDGLIHVRFGFILELVSGEFRLFRMNQERPF